MTHPGRDDPQTDRDVALLRDILAASGSKRAVDALGRLRAVVAAHPAGPGQDEPAAPEHWLVEWPCIDESEPWEGETFDDADDAESRREDVASEFAHEYGERVAGLVRVVPLFRAREVQATGPAADEDALLAVPGTGDPYTTLPRLSKHHLDLVWGYCFGGMPSGANGAPDGWMESLVAEVIQRRAADAPPAPASGATAPAADEGAVERVRRAAEDAWHETWEMADEAGDWNAIARAALAAALAPPAAAPGAETTTDEDARVKHQMTATSARARGDWDAERAALDQIHLLDLVAARRAEQQDQP